MRVWRRALDLLGFQEIHHEGQQLHTYQQMMKAALNRIHMAELQLKEATSLEELDIARSMLLSGHAEVQQLVRTAKRDRGIALRPIAETEEIHRTLKETMFPRSSTERSSGRRKTGTR
jgi:hypothetical protein